MVALFPQLLDLSSELPYLVLAENSWRHSYDDRFGIVSLASLNLFISIFTSSSVGRSVINTSLSSGGNSGTSDNLLCEAIPDDSLFKWSGPPHFKISKESSNIPISARIGSRSVTLLSFVKLSFQ